MFFWNADEWALIAHQDWSIVEVVNMCQKANFMKLLFIWHQDLLYMTLLAMAEVINEAVSLVGFA